MILIPELERDVLKINAYSYSDDELGVVNTFLRNRDFDFRSTPIARDRHERKGLRFIIAGLIQIGRFENLLGIRFRPKQNGTMVAFDSDAGGDTYCCLRIGKVAWEKGCEEINAEDDYAAFIKCSFLANEKNWFGVESERGKCDLRPYNL